MAAYGTVRRTAPFDFLRTIRFPGSRLSSASTSRLFEPSNTIVRTSPKSCLAADAAAGASATGSVLDRSRAARFAEALEVRAAPPRVVVSDAVEAGALALLTPDAVAAGADVTGGVAAAVVPGTGADGSG